MEEKDRELEILLARAREKTLRRLAKMEEKDRELEILLARVRKSFEENATKAVNMDYKNEWAMGRVVLETRPDKVVAELQEIKEKFDELGWTVEDINITAEAGYNAVEIRISAPTGFSKIGYIRLKLNDFTKQEYELYKNALEYVNSIEQRLKEQEEKLKNSKAYELYTYFSLYKRKLGEKAKLVDELVYKIRKKVLTNEELREAIKQLEEIYDEIKQKEMQEQLEQLKNENERLKNLILDLKKKQCILSIFIAEHHSKDEFINWLANFKAEEIREELIEEVEDLVYHFEDDEEAYY
ncbi:hypothetical protein H5T51_04525 [Candidatus Bathyarchaeota archaeon]|nr:hypothetical protein [Candidatus Bathyarchaeota archaeon]